MPDKFTDRLIEGATSDYMEKIEKWPEQWVELEETKIKVRPSHEQVEDWFKS
jgi:hypothetical protein